MNGRSSRGVRARVGRADGAGADVGNLGFMELALVAVVALVVFGPERLPELARQAGGLLARVRRETSKSMEELKRAADLGDLNDELRGLSRDLRDVRSSVSRSLQSGEGGPGRPAEQPPPTDPEAT